MNSTALPHGQIPTRSYPVPIRQQHVIGARPCSVLDVPAGVPQPQRATTIVRIRNRWRRHPRYETERGPRVRLQPCTWKTPRLPTTQPCRWCRVPWSPHKVMDGVCIAMVRVPGGVMIGFSGPTPTTTLANRPRLRPILIRARNSHRVTARIHIRACAAFGFPVHVLGARPSRWGYLSVTVLITMWPPGPEFGSLYEMKMLGSVC